jgi:4-amino-4-deoxy-L-arabinose transferase-like glycosyltransferase
VLFGMTLPWSLGLLAAFNRRFWQSTLQPLGLLMLIWLLLIFIFFSIPASKLIGYILPALPPLAVDTSSVIFTIGYQSFPGQQG